MMALIILRIAELNSYNKAMHNPASRWTRHCVARLCWRRYVS